MPIYEYRCRSCRRRVQLLTLRIGEPPDEVCGFCGARNLDRLPSRVALLRSNESRLDALARSAESAGLDGDDPREAARWMRRMSSELGEEAGVEDFGALADEIETAAAEPDDPVDDGSSG